MCELKTAQKLPAWSPNFEILNAGDGVLLPSAWRPVFGQHGLPLRGGGKCASQAEDRSCDPGRLEVVLVEGGVCVLHVYALHALTHVTQML
mmetsp:Transcript_44723/g.114360  ORF Transcript_44723/g.114360 Transcript_44723/m.114360 type:complete len:91 (-) Transcript_44723:1316-1588(-)